jgi:hypothetical protein
MHWPSGDRWCGDQWQQQQLQGSQQQQLGVQGPPLQQQGLQESPQRQQGLQGPSQQQQGRPRLASRVVSEAVAQLINRDGISYAKQHGLAQPIGTAAPPSVPIRRLISKVQQDEAAGCGCSMHDPAAPGGLAQQQQLAGVFLDSGCPAAPPDLLAMQSSAQPLPMHPAWTAAAGKGLCDAQTLVAIADGVSAQEQGATLLFESHPAALGDYFSIQELQKQQLQQYVA